MQLQSASQPCCLLPIHAILKLVSPAYMQANIHLIGLFCVALHCRTNISDQVRPTLSELSLKLTCASGSCLSVRSTRALGYQTQASA